MGDAVTGEATNSPRFYRRKRFGAREPGSWAERGKQARFLSQRGFSSDQVRAAIGRDLDGE